MQNVHVEEVQCKTILNRSVMDFADYTLNAYEGCALGCSYCYVPAMRMRRGQEDEHAWGGWVRVKVNAPDVLRRQMLRVPPESIIAIGTAADSWQPLEKKYEVARKILLELSYYPNPVRLLTRSPLLMRDIDLLCKIEKLSVGVSLPTFDEFARRVFEPHAPAIPGRVHLIRQLVNAGLSVKLFWCPILYGVSDNPDAVRDYLRQASELGISGLIYNTLHHTEHVGGRHMRLLRTYRESGGPSDESLTKPELYREISRWARHYGVKLYV